MAEKGTRGGPLGSLGNSLGAMPAGRRMGLFGGVALFAAALVALFLWINQPNYSVLYSGIKQEDAAQVVEKLKELKVPYQLEMGGGVIKVPAEQVHETRLALAGAGLPKSNGVGFEVFNQVKMGTTEFVQKINLQRALQGELARTISSFSEVEEARVHIVMPRTSLFVEEERKPSAGVVVRMVAGRRLTRSQIAGIVHLVAASVPELTDDRVTVVDTKGNLIYRKSADTPGFSSGLTANQLEFQREVESRIRNKAQSMLEEVLGPGRAVVRVAANIDFTQTTTTQDLFNPDQVAVRSETRQTNKSQDQGAVPRGSPDQRFTLAAKNATPNSGGSGATANESEKSTTNFEISRTRKQVVQAIAGVKQVSVAVIVDGPYKETATGGQTTRTFQGRSPEQMRQLSDLVRQAVGFNEDRGDKVTVANVPFAMQPTAGAMVGKTWQDYLQEYYRPALNFILLLLFFLFVARPLLKQFSARRAGGEGGLEAVRVGPAEELPSGMAGERDVHALPPETEVPKIGLRDQVLALAQQDPERATNVIRAWIHEG